MNMFRKATKTEFRNKQGKLAKDIIDWLLKKEIFDDTFIYVNGKRYGTYDGEGHYNYGTSSWDKVYVEDNKDPKDYFEYAGKILSMSFEGPLYDLLNYGFEWNSHAEDELRNIFHKYGYYFELGNAWNLTAVEE
jgi:hypothetical protein